MPAPTRRHVLAAFAAAALLDRSSAQSPPQARTPYRIDIHHHLFAPQYVAAIGDLAAAFPPWTAQQSLDVMDQGGVEKSLLSLSLPGVWLPGAIGGVEAARRLSRIVNDFGAQLVRDHPGRFGLFAVVPLPDVEGTLREIEYAYDTLNAEGLGLMTSFDDKYLGDASFAPVWEELNRREAVVYTHPLTAACCGGMNYALGPGAIEWATDTTRTIASLLFTGTAARYPNIKWIFSHGGGTAPFLLSRFIREEQFGKGNMKQVFPRGLMYELRKFYYDTAQANSPGALDALLEMVPASQVLYGSDYPYRTFEEVSEGLGSYGFNSNDLRAIERDNALLLLEE